MKTILQRYDWAPQPCTANCSYVIVKDPLDNGEPTYAVYTWNRDQDFFFEGGYTETYTQALEELLRWVRRYESRYGVDYPGHWVFETEEK